MPEKSAGSVSRGWALLVGVAFFLALSAPIAVSGQDVVLVLDNSGSMRKNDPGFLVKDAVTGFVQNLQPDVRIAVLIFDQDLNWAVPFTEVNDANEPEILNSLVGVKYDGLYTDSRGAMELAADELENSGRPGVQKVIVFLTDGIVDTGNPILDAQNADWLRQDFAVSAAENGIAVIGIAFTDDADHDLVRILASTTGGSYFNVSDARDLGSTLEEVALVLTTPSTPVEPTESVAISTTGLEEGEEAVVSTPEGTPITTVADESSTDAGETPAPEAGTEQTASEYAGKTDIALEFDAVTEREAADAGQESSKQEAIPAGDRSPGLTEDAVPPVPDLAPPEPAVADTAKDVTTTARGEEDRSVYVIAALVVIVLVVLGVVLILRSRRVVAGDAPSARTEVLRDDASSAPTQLLRDNDSSAPTQRLKDSASSAPTQVLKREPPVGEAQMSVAYLVDLGRITGKPRHTLRARRTVITRSDEIQDSTAEHIQIPAETISRLHAAIEYDAGAFWILDYGSTNGTFRNDLKVTDRQRLQDGDKVRFDEFDFLFSAPAAASDATVLHRRGSSGEAETVKVSSKS